MLAIALRPLPFPEPLDAALARVGDTLAPLALLSVGLQLRLGALRGQARLLSIGLAYKLVACPAIVFAVLWLLDAELDMTRPRQHDRGRDAADDRRRHRRGGGTARRAAPSRP